MAPEVFSRVGCDQHSLYPTPQRISTLGTLVLEGETQLL